MAGGALRQRCDKRFYVSPFMEMDLAYAFRLTVPAARLTWRSMCMARAG